MNSLRIISLIALLVAVIGISEAKKHHYKTSPDKDGNGEQGGDKIPKPSPGHGTGVQNTGHLIGDATGDTGDLLKNAGTNFETGGPFVQDITKNAGDTVKNALNNVGGGLQGGGDDKKGQGQPKKGGKGKQ